MGVVVASVPASHVYVRHLDAPGGSPDVVRLADPPVSDTSPATQWWPPVMLDPHWVGTHSDDFDVMHVHFGFDHQSPADLQRLVDTLRDHRKPLVLTVHDLRNPHHDEAEPHDAQLGVLVSAAAAVITLTPGAADEIRRRWGRGAHVLPHPHVVDEPRLSGRRRAHDGFVIGVHVKSLRANTDPLPVIEAIVADLPRMPGASLRVDAHADVMRRDAGHRSHRVATHLARLDAAGLIDLHVHDYFTDDELWDYLSSLDVSVLPYRFGTHSGWLEACFDLGTTVLAPDCGYYAEQRPCVTYAVPGAARAGAADSGADVPSLSAAIRCVYEERPAWRADPGARRTERVHLARAHEAIYATVMAGGALCTS